MDRAEIKAEVDRVKLEIEQAVQQTASALEAWQASRDAATKPQLFTIYNNNVETERSLRALLQSLIDKLPAAGAAGPSEAGGAGPAAASAASGAECAVKGVTLVTPSLLGEREDYEWKVKQPLTKSRFLKLMQEMGVRGVVEKEVINVNGALVPKTKLVPVSEVELQNGETYVLFGDTVVPELTTWAANQNKSFENSVGERVLLLMQRDHPDAVRLCRNVFQSTDKTIKLELDVVVVSEHCVMVAEVKNSLVAAPVEKQVDTALEKIRELIAKDPDGADAAVFRGKEIKVALAGMYIAAQERGPLTALADSRGWPVFLPGGAHLIPGDGCFASSAMLRSCAVDDRDSPSGGRGSSKSSAPAAVRVLRSEHPGACSAGGMAPFTRHLHPPLPIGSRVVQRRGMTSHAAPRSAKLGSFG